MIGDEGYLLNMDSPVSILTGIKGALILAFDSVSYFHATRLAGSNFLNKRIENCKNHVMSIQNSITDRMKGLIERGNLISGHHLQTDIIPPKPDINFPGKSDFDLEMV
jgi:hypothetical protein